MSTSVDTSLDIGIECDARSSSPTSPARIELRRHRRKQRHERKRRERANVWRRKGG
jgi:hypothetical protein